MKSVFRIVSGLLLLSLFLGFAAQPVQAGSNCPTVSFSFTHRVNGTKLGLSQEFPLIAEVYFGPNLRLLTSIPLEYLDNGEFNWTHGVFVVKYFSVELNSYVDTMQVGPVNFDRCTKVGLHSKILDGVGVTTITTRPLIPQ